VRRALVLSCRSNKSTVESGLTEWRVAYCRHGIEFLAVHNDVILLTSLLGMVVKHMSPLDRLKSCGRKHWIIDELVRSGLL
jgi:hypothetical protein